MGLAPFFGPRIGHNKVYTRRAERWLIRHSVPLAGAEHQLALGQPSDIQNDLALRLILGHPQASGWIEESRQPWPDPRRPGRPRFP